MAKVLITYYTKTNTTKEICEYIEKQLTGKGDQVTLQPMENATEISEYDKVVIGAPINGMIWAETAKSYVEANQDVLQDKEVFLFMNAFMLDNCRNMWNNRLHKSLDKYEAMIGAKAIGKFGGRSDKPMSGFPKFLFGTKDNTTTDRRDWSSIDLFTEKI